MKYRNCPNHIYQFYENWKWENVQLRQQATNILNVSCIAVAAGMKTLRREDLFLKNNCTYLLESTIAVLQNIILQYKYMIKYNEKQLFFAI